MTGRSVLAVSLLVLVFGACGGDDDEGSETKVTTETSAPGEKTDGAPQTLKSRLSGTEESPGPGVKDGVGSVVIDITGTNVCYDLKATMGEKPTKAHIHEGAKGASGPVVVDLKPAFEPGEAAYTAKSCVDLTPDVAANLLGDPAGYYVNVHSDAHPDGAMRGQLGRL